MPCLKDLLRETTNLFFQLKKFWQKKPVYIKNSAYLFITQIANYILPFLTLPYLSRVLSLEKFGIISFYQGLTNFFIILSEYGFPLLAPRVIALNRDDFKKLQKNFSTIFFAKLLLFVFVALLYSFLALGVKEVRRHFEVGLLFLIMVFGQILFPQWYFQGIETMGVISLLNFLAKFLNTLLIFLFVKSEDDFLLVPTFYATAWLLSGLMGFFLAMRTNKSLFTFPTWQDIKMIFVDGLAYFISNLSSTSLQTITPFVLGIISGVEEVGRFSAAERIVGALKFILHPFHQGLYPTIARKISQEGEKCYPFLKRLFFIFAAFGLITSLPLFFLAQEIIGIVAGQAFQSSVIILQVLSIHPFIVFLSIFLGMQILINLEKKRYLTKMIFLGAILNFCILPFLAYFYQALGAAISITIAEVFIFLALFLYVKKLGVL